jgi:hypothetical protein
LREAGHNVVIPESGTNPDWDVMIDRQKYNVKVTDDPSYITNFLHHHPDVDVITNNEMASAFADNPHVHIDPALSAQDAFHATDATFHGIDSLGAWLHHIPLITLAAASVRHGKGYAQGRKSLGDAAKQTAMDVGGVGFGAFGGGKVGLMAGLLLAPATGGLSAIVVPAATTLVGSIIGVLSGKKIAYWFKSGDLRAAQAVLKEKAAALRSSFLMNCGYIVGTIHRLYRTQDRNFRMAASRAQGWLERLLAPTVMTKFYSMARKRAKQEMRNTQDFYFGLRKECNKHEDQAAAGLIVYAQDRNLFSYSAPVLNAWDGVHQSIEIVNREKARLA